MNMGTELVIQKLTKFSETFTPQESSQIVDARSRYRLLLAEVILITSGPLD